MSQTCIRLKSASYFKGELIDLHFPLKKVSSQMLHNPQGAQIKSCDRIPTHASTPNPSPFTHSHTELIGTRFNWVNPSFKGIWFRPKQLKLVPFGA